MSDWKQFRGTSRIHAERFRGFVCLWARFVFGVRCDVTESNDCTITATPGHDHIHGWFLLLLLLLLLFEIYKLLQSYTFKQHSIQTYKYKQSLLNYAIGHVQFHSWTTQSYLIP